jgi:DNA-binding NarL/FixJ family response regulator
MTGGGRPTRVAIVDDHRLFAQALELSLTMEGYDVHRQDIWERAVPDQLLAGLLHASPQIVLLDLDLAAAGNGVRLIEPLVRAHISVVVLTGSSDHARWGECLRQGAATVLSKSDPIESILATIQCLSERRPVLAREDRERLIGEFRREQSVARDLRRKLESLTPRERSVLAHLMLGRPVREIAQVSFVSEATVRTQVKSILAKLEVTSQLAAVGAAHLVEWRPPAAPTAC